LVLITSQAIKAQTTVHYTDGDAMLGFWSTDRSNDYLDDLGPAAAIRDAPPGTTLTFPTSSADLAQVFGADWYTRIDPNTQTYAVLWAVVGARQFTDGTDPNNTLYSSNPSAMPWLRHSNSTQGVTRSLIDSMGLTYDGNLSTNNCPTCIIQADSTQNSYRSFQPPGGVNSGGISFQTWNPSNQGGPPVLLYFNRIIPSTTAGLPGQSIGTLTVDSSGTLTYTAAAPPQAQSAFSRRVHGGAGTFDIPLPLTGNVGIECRTGSNDQMIINFASNVTVDSVSVTSGTGMVDNFSGNGTPTITVNLSGVTDQQRITVTLHNVNNGNGMGDVPVSMGVLIGDTNANGTVSAGDVAQTKSQAGQPVTGTNFREDVNASGTITSTDVAIVKSKVGDALPPDGSLTRALGR
jgi:hypothetical protein